MTRVLVLLGLASCVIPAATGKSDPLTTPGEPTNPSPQPTGPVDQDNDLDGYPASEDCDDENEDVFPGAPELCDGLDNDCDKVVDGEAAATVDRTNYDTVNEAILAAMDSGADEISIDICDSEKDIPVGDKDGSPFILRDNHVITVRGLGGKEATNLTSMKGQSLFEITEAGSLTLEAVTISGTVDDPAILVTEDGVLTLNGSEINDNAGSGVAIDDTTPPDANSDTEEGVRFFCNDSVFDNNRPGAESGRGGAVYAVGNFRLSFVGCTLSNNRAAFGAGLYARAVISFENAVSFKNSVISGNVASQGGGMHLTSLQGRGVLTMEGTVIQTNEANAGAGAFVEFWTVQGDGVTSFEGNIASQEGGGLHIAGVNAVDDVLISGNDARFGGGIFVAPLKGLSGFPEELDGVVLDSNTADIGGGVYVSGGRKLELDGSCRLTLNEADEYGGGAYVDVADDGSIESNGAQWGGAPSSNSPDDVAWLDGGKPESIVISGTDDFVCDNNELPVGCRFK